MSKHEISVNKKRDRMNLLYKDNDLVKSKYDTTAVINRIFTIILYKFQTDGRSLYCRMSANEIRSVIKNKNQHDIKYIKGILNTLKDTEILISELSKSGKSYNEHSYNLIAGWSYYGDSDEFEIQAVQKIYSLVAKRFDDGYYTPVNLPIFLSLKKPYTQRFYDLLRLWSGSKKKINYSIENLRSYLVLENKYPNYADIKRRVIDPSVKELNETGRFFIEYKENKVGKAVDNIDFFVEDYDPRTIRESIADELVLKNELINQTVPDRSLISDDVVLDLLDDFEGCSFMDGKTKDIFMSVCKTVLKKDGAKQIDARNYALFKTILETKI